MKNNITFSQVTGGTLRGRKIKSPNSDKTHPMGSRERLAILNSIGPDIVDANVIDLYAGTGALGIEALSRGAKQVIFIEKNSKVASILAENCSELGLSNCAKIIISAVESAEPQPDADIVFVDPPYDKFQLFVDNFETIYEKFLKNAQKIIISHPKNVELTFSELENYQRTEKTFAGAGISIFTK